MNENIHFGTARLWGIIYKVCYWASFLITSYVASGVQCFQHLHYNNKIQDYENGVLCKMSYNMRGKFQSGSIKTGIH